MRECSRGHSGRVRFGLLRERREPRGRSDESEESRDVLAGLADKLEVVTRRQLAADPQIEVGLAIEIRDADHVAAAHPAISLQEHVPGAGTRPLHSLPDNAELAVAEHMPAFQMGDEIRCPVGRMRQSGHRQRLPGAPLA